MVPGKPAGEHLDDVDDKQVQFHPEIMATCGQATNLDLHLHY